MCDIHFKFRKPNFPQRLPWKPAPPNGRSLVFQAAQFDFYKVFIVLTKGNGCECDGNGCRRCFPILQKSCEDPRVLKFYVDIFDIKYSYIGDNDPPRVVEEITQYYLSILRNLGLLE